MNSTVHLTLVRDYGSQEYKITYRINGRLNPDLTYFTDDEEDAIRTFITECNNFIIRYGKNNVSWAWNKLTNTLLDKYDLRDKLGG